MGKKTTQELLNELKVTDSAHAFLSTNSEEMRRGDLSARLEALLRKEGRKKADIIAASGLHQIYAYQIFSGRKRPSRDKLLALCFAMTLTLDEVQHLLTIADVGILYPRVKRDSILIFALHKKLDVITCNELLFEQNEPILQ